MIRGEVVHTRIADQYRADLQENGIGDGHYGYTIEPDLDLDVGLRAQIDDVRVVARNPVTGEVIPMMLTELAQSQITEIAKANTEPLQVLGNAFVVENIREFNPSYGDLQRFSFGGAPALILSRKLEAFGGGIWWSAPGTPSADFAVQGMGPCIASLAKRGALHVMFDMSNEGQPFMHLSFWLDLFHAKLDEIGLPPHACTLVTQNRLMPEMYAAWCDEKGRADKLNVTNYDYYVRRFTGLCGQHAEVETVADAIAQHYSDRSVARSRRYLCMNFTPRPHRVAFLSWLFGSGQDACGYISFAGFNMLKMDASESPLPANWLRSDIIDRGFEILKARGRMTLDLPTDGDTTVPEFDVGNPHFYRDSYFSVVTESDVSDGDLRRITEKVIKPIALFHPMLIVGNSGSLDILREFGFRTFAPFINEDYDRVADSQTRLEMVAAELKRLNDMSTEEMTAWYQGLSEVLVYNYLHLHRGLNDRFRFEIEPKLLETVAGNARRASL